MDGERNDSHPNTVGIGMGRPYSSMPIFIPVGYEDLLTVCFLTSLHFINNPSTWHGTVRSLFLVNLRYGISLGLLVISVIQTNTISKISYWILLTRKSSYYVVGICLKLVSLCSLVFCCSLFPVQIVTLMSEIPK